MGRLGRVVLIAWVEGCELKVDRGPIVGWVWEEESNFRVTVMFGHDDADSYLDHLGWAFPAGRAGDEARTPPAR